MTDLESSEIWRDPDWEECVERKIRDDGVVVPRVVREFVANYGRVCGVLEQCSFPGYAFLLTTIGDQFRLELTYKEADVYSGVLSTQTARPWLISQDATESQVIQTLFKAILTSMEHRVRENFHWMGKPVLMPHMDLRQVWETVPNSMHQQNII